MAFSTQTITQILISKKKLLALSILMGLVIALLSYKIVPRTYKVGTTIALQTQYFQVPLVQDFVPVTFDETEIRSERESFVRRSLNHEYLRDLGTRFGLFGKAKPDSISSWSLDLLAKDFEIINVNATTFLVNYRTTNPDQGYQVMLDFTAHLRSFLALERKAMLSKLHAAIQDRLEILSFGRTSGGAQLMVSRPDLVKEQMGRLRKELAQLKATYSPMHPRVTEMEGRLAQLSGYLKKKAPTDTDPLNSEKFSGARLDPSSQDLFKDLLKKYHYLSVVMYMDQKNPDSYLVQLQEPSIPHTAIWPKLPIFIAWGLAVGLLMGTLIIFAQEAGFTLGWRKVFARLQWLSRETAVSETSS